MKLRELLKACVSDVNRIRLIPTDSEHNEGLGETFQREDLPPFLVIIKAQNTSKYLDDEVEAWMVCNNCLSVLVKVEELNESDK